MHLAWAACSNSIFPTFQAIEEQSKLAIIKVSAGEDWSQFQLMKMVLFAFSMKDQHGKTILPAGWYPAPCSRVQKVNRSSKPSLDLKLYLEGTTLRSFSFWRWHGSITLSYNWTQQQTEPWEGHFSTSSSLKPCRKRFFLVFFEENKPIVSNMEKR